MYTERQPASKGRACREGVCSSTLWSTCCLLDCDCCSSRNAWALRRFLSCAFCRAAASSAAGSLSHLDLFRGTVELEGSDIGKQAGGGLFGRCAQSAVISPLWGHGFWRSMSYLLVCQSFTVLPFHGLRMTSQFDKWRSIRRPSNVLPTSRKPPGLCDLYIPAANAHPLDAAR